MNAIILSVFWALVMMFCSITVKNKSFYKTVALTGLLVILAANIWNTYHGDFFAINTKGMLLTDKFGLFFNTLMLASTFIYVWLSGNEIEKAGTYTAEYYALIFFVLSGIFILSSYANLLMLFLGIEILSIPLYILTGSDKRNLKSNEASLKYFLTGAFSTGLMLMGITLIYGATGSFQLEFIRNFNAGMASGNILNTASLSFLEITGLLFLLASMAFKVSAAPFHFWTPDVYDGAPTVFTSFMATIAKAAAFIAFLKLFDARAFATNSAQNKLIGVDWKLLFSILIVATLLIGNITALFQQSVKRMLAYSSIAQAGFMLFAVFSLNDFAKEGLLLYATAYCLATIGLFAVLSKMKDITFEGYNGLAQTHPALAFATAVFLFSLAGIPLTAGFFAKYYMLAAAVKAGGYIWLVVLAVLFAAVSVAYYFRIIQAMYFKNPDSVTELPIVSKSFNAALIFLSAIIIFLGIYPQWLLNWFYF